MFESDLIKHWSFKKDGIKTFHLLYKLLEWRADCRDDHFEDEFSVL